MAIFIGNLNAQELSTEKELKTEELPSIEPVKNLQILDPLDPIDISTRNITMTGYLRGGGPGNALDINTGNGTIDIGAQNGSWAHIYTSNPNFIFNKPIYTVNGVFGSYSTSNLYLRTNGTNRMTILNSNGYVGIGTTAPLGDLHIYRSHLPNFILQNAISRLVIGIATNAGECDYSSKPGDVVYRSFTSAPQHGLIFNMADNNNDGKSYIKFTDDLRVIMGIFNDATVRVNGRLYAKEIHVKTNVWGDFVFDKDYALLSLSDLENYIKEHKHLPGVPSESEVIEKGINVSDMNVILMQKVEELTLYMIEQDKKIRELEKEVKELKNN